MPPTERTWSHPRKIFDADCTISYVLNSGITEPNLTKFLQGVQRWLRLLGWNQNCDLPIRWKLQRDEWRSSSNCGRIAAKIACFNSINSEITGRKFTKLGHDVSWLLQSNLLKADLWSANPLSNAKAKSKGHSTRRLRTSPIFNWLP